MKDKIKDCVTGSMSVIGNLLTNGWNRDSQVTPVHMLRELSTDPLAAAVAVIIFRGVINNEWEPVALSLSVIEGLSGAAIIDISYRLARTFKHRAEYENFPSKALDSLIGGLPKNIQVSDRLYGGLRFLIPAAVAAVGAYTYTVNQNADNADVASWDWGSLLENVGIASGVGAASGLAIDVPAKTVNYCMDGLKRCWKERNNRSDYMDIDNDGDLVIGSDNKNRNAFTV